MSFSSPFFSNIQTKTKKKPKQASFASLDLLCNEKDKEEEHLKGAICVSARVNMIIFVV